MRSEIVGNDERTRRQAQRIWLSHRLGNDNSEASEFAISPSLKRFIARVVRILKRVSISALTVAFMQNSQIDLSSRSPAVNSISDESRSESDSESDVGTTQDRTFD